MSVIRVETDQDRGEEEGREILLSAETESVEQWDEVRRGRSLTWWKNKMYLILVIPQIQQGMNPHKWGVETKLETW